MSNEVIIKNAVKRYGDFTALSDVSLHIKEGEFFTLLGPSGCGKTTLLRMIAGFNSIEGGEFFFGDKIINNVPAHKRDIGMVGKIGVTDVILNKKGALTPEERNSIEKHVTIGGDILKDFTAIEGIAEGARYHHERYDGKGYACGLKGEEIPLFARIIAVADSFDAMSSERCYRPALEMPKIISELENGAGTQFDAKIVKHMLDMIEDKQVPVEL